MQTDQAVSRASADAPKREAAVRQRFRDNMPQPVRSANDPVCVRRAQKRRRDAVSTGTAGETDVPDAPFSSSM